MMQPDRSFKRVVLYLGHRFHNAETVQLAAELARLLHLDLLGRFVDDPGLVKLAALPFSREYRVTEGEWHPLLSDEVHHSRDLAIAVARRLFAHAATGAGRFELIGEGGCAAPADHDEDIVVVRQIPSGLESIDIATAPALRAAAGVLFVPNRIARRRGPVLAVASSANDPSLRTAASLAAAAGEKLLQFDRLCGAAPASGGGATIGNVDAPNERIIVVSRDTITDTMLHSIAVNRGIPILVLNPAK
jgi:hypothetical protein